MLRKYWFVVVVAILVVIPIVLGIYVAKSGKTLKVGLSGKAPSAPSNLIAVADKPGKASDDAADNFIVVRWDQGSGTLQVGKKGGDKILNLKIEIPKTSVYIPRVKDGVEFEDLVMIGQGEWWNKAFCYGDTVNIPEFGKDLSKFTNNQVVWITEIHNMGPRRCGI
jgi:hypothetical protein